MSWNYRVMKHRDKTPEHLHKKNPEVFPEYNESYAIHEVYYDDKGVVDGYSKNAVPLYADELDNLKDDLQLMLKAFEKPVLEYENEDNPPENNEGK